MVGVSSKPKIPPDLEPMTGIEPALSAWEAEFLLLSTWNYVAYQQVNTLSRALAYAGDMQK